jgi:hypothetical protein
MIEATVDLTTADGQMDTFLCHPERGGSLTALLRPRPLSAHVHTLPRVGRRWLLCSPAPGRPAPAEPSVSQGQA